ncbi:NADH-quinone oxidoreductase subunit J family protein [Chrysiogenes arsenatis]|uniref:NADH-quinone oxidoreductase subunit J family protein n=1 Tax=Chrysiogenes arsenatis TaxID=309797 RepID=UPI0003F6B01B|nr:NADH-quinone oxidoreductase subunit J [Chrysiogenes arsenatis]
MELLSLVLFLGFAGLAVAGAAGLILFRHPLNSALSFIVTLIALAGLYAMLSASLLFAVQIIVYAGAIMSLIVFIIMFLNVRDADLPAEPTRWYFLIGGAVVLTPVGAFLLKVVRQLPGADMSVPLPEGFGGIHAVGQLLFIKWVFPFEIVSVLLVVALLGAVMLAKRKV